MKTLDMELDTDGAEMSDLRPLLDDAIDKHFSEGFLNHRWEGDVLHLKGPGARGSLRCEAGLLKLRAELKPPASWAHQKIRRKLDNAFTDVAEACATLDREPQP